MTERDDMESIGRCRVCGNRISLCRCPADEAEIVHMVQTPNPIFPEFTKDSRHALNVGYCLTHKQRFKCCNNCEHEEGG